MTHTEKVTFLMEAFDVRVSMLAALLGLTETSLTTDTPGQKATARLDKLATFVQMANQAGITDKGWLWNMLDQPLNMMSLPEEDQDCHRCAHYYISDDESLPNEMLLAFEAAIEIFSREVKIYDLEQEIKKLKGGSK